MINKLKLHPDLQCKGCITSTCAENDLAATMDSRIPADSFVIIKVDSYYSSLKLCHTPPSIDCLIVLKCADGQFVIYLVELKNIKSPSGFDHSNIYGKFKTTLEDFMSQRFQDIFFDPHQRIKDIHLYFVSNPYRLTHISHKKEGTKMDKLLSHKPFKFRGIISDIKIKNEISCPIIEGC